MIINALAAYYDQLRDESREEVAEPGWTWLKISYLLVLSQDGELVDVIPAPDKQGWMKRVPERVKRSSGFAANLLADNSSYFLGVDGKGKPERAKCCFEAAKKAHLDAFSSVASDAGRALCAFFESWEPDRALKNEAVVRAGDGLLTGGYLSFMLGQHDIADDEAVAAAWDERRSLPSDDDVVMTCLDTGKSEPVSLLHPAIKGVYGGEPTGVSLVSFNERAFESYGHVDDQGLNAPVSREGAFKYTTALDFLVSDNEHHVRIGDTTVVYWAEHGDAVASPLMSLLMGSQSVSAKLKEAKGSQAVDENIDVIMKKLSQGKLADVEGLDPSATFYMLGIAPNKARLSIRFFVRNSFGAMLENINRHYGRLSVTHSEQDPDFLSPYQLVRAADDPKAKKSVVASELGGALMQSILTDTPYPESLYENMLLRIRATHDDAKKGSRKITYERAAFIKAYLIKNRNLYEEGTMETLDAERDEVAYALGRLFWTLEDLQHAANPNINSTINDRYFNAAVATPSKVFPSMLKTAQDHLSKLKRDKAARAFTYDKKIQEETALIRNFPKTLPNDAQGDFILGYYHQKNAGI